MISSRECVMCRDVMAAESMIFKPAVSLVWVLTAGSKLQHVYVCV